MAEIQRAMNLSTEFERGGKVIVDGLDGAVVVEGWDRSEVSLAATKHIAAASEADAERLLEDMQTTFRRSGDELTISVPGAHGTRYGGNGWIDCYVRVPASCDLYVDTSSGSVDVRGVNGSIRLDTGSGSTTLRQCGGDIVVDTGSGAVVAEEIDGDLNIDVGSGSVTIAGVTGGLFVDAGSGSVNARRIGGKATIDSAGPVSTSDTGGDLIIDASGTVKAIASRGGFAHIDTGSSVEAEFLISRGGRYSIDAGGDTRVSVPATASLEIKGEAHGLKYDLPLSMQRMDDNEFEATLNGRGARLSVDIGGRLTLLPSQLAPESSEEQPQIGADEAGEVSGAEETSRMGTQSASAEPGPDLRMIIQMVAEKKITPEEADELLKAMGGSPDQY